MSVWPANKPDETEADHHFSIDLLPDERDALVDALDGNRLGSVMANKLTRRLRDAIRRDGLPLPPACLNWADAERRARERGQSLPDYIFDVARGKDAA